MNNDLILIKKYQWNATNNSFIELYWDEGLCIKIDNGPTAIFNQFSWK